MMTRKYYLINFVLVLLIVFLVSKSYEVWTAPGPGEKDQSASKPRGTGSPAPVPGVSKKEMPVPAHFKGVSEKNIFSTDRKEFPVPLATPETKRPPVRPTITLYGITLADDLQMALINNPTRRIDKGERETMTVKAGDRVGEYTVAKILGDRITMESSGDSFDVLLYDPGKPKRRSSILPLPSPSSPTPPYTPTPLPPRPFTRPPGGTSPSMVPPPVTPLPPPGSITPPMSPTPPPPAMPGRGFIRGRTEPGRVTVQPGRTPARPVPVEDEDDEED